MILLLGAVLYQNHMVTDWQGSAAHEIQKIIESPLAQRNKNEIIDSLHY